MKTIRLIIFSLLNIGVLETYCNAQNGTEIFASHCAACHTIGKGDLIGPDLKDVEKTHTEAWILKWVRSSQMLIKQKDKAAIELFEKSHEIVMPDQLLSEAEIKSVLAYIKSEGDNKPIVASSLSEPVSAPPIQTQADSNSSSEKTSTTYLSIFSISFLNYLWIGLAIFFLIIIWMLSKVINTLSDQLKEQFKKNNTLH